MKKILKNIFTCFIFLFLFMVCSCSQGENVKPIHEEKEIIDISKLPTKGVFTEGGYTVDEPVLKFGTGGLRSAGCHSIGKIDLRKYNKVIVYYGNIENVSEIGTLVLKTSTEYYVGTTECTPAKQWTDRNTSVTFDISNIREAGEMFLELKDAENGIVVNKIELVVNENPIGIYPEYEYDSVFICGSGADLNTYYEKSYDDYNATCKFYKDKGFTIYNQNEKNGNHFTTFVRGSKMAHVYWIACEEELNVIYSDTNGANLPPQKPAVTTGSYKTTVTQIKGDGNDVTGYIYQLADGSFIIYDGGNAACADEIKNTLTTLSGGKEIIVRAWVLTVAESNNYRAFSAFASKYASSIKLETIITAPISEKISSPVSKTYLTSTLKTDAAKFSGVKVCYAHTGMDFTFCNVKMEILFTAEEQYICDVPRIEKGSTEAAEFRNTSLVSRIVTDNCNVMMLSNIGLNSARRMVIYYRDYLKSDICQMAENGLGDLSMYIYNVIGAPTLFCPATTNTFNTNTTNKTVRDTLAKSVATKKIILLDSAENSIVLDDVVKRDTTAADNFTGILNPATLTVGYEYTCFNADKMYYYFDITAAQAKGVMSYYATNGYEAYSTFIGNGNYAATYTKGAEMIHMYWYEIENRMTIVKSSNGANTLPDKALANITGNFDTSITQLKSKQINGMGYVIQLEDGSFIIYDGGYRDTTDTEILDELWGTLNDLTPDGNRIIIRAWIITHPHGDHYGTFVNFCNTYAKNVTLETMIVNQITEEVRRMQANDGYLQKYLAADVAKFEETVICNVYPGMVFDFGSLRMEILGTYHDAYILSTPKGTGNNTCVVSRLVTENDQMLLLADAGVDQMEPMAAYFGDYLKSTNCQVSHHGVEDCPLIVYRHIQASRLWYPCDTYLYNLTDRDADVRKALKESKYTKEILLHDLTRKTRTLG